MQTGFLVNTWTMTKGQSLSDLLFTSSHFLTLRSGRTRELRNAFSNCGVRLRWNFCAQMESVSNCGVPVCWSLTTRYTQVGSWDPDGPWDTQSISNGQLSLSQNVSMQCSSALNHEMIQLSIRPFCSIIFSWYFHYSVLFWLSTCWHLNHSWHPTAPTISCLLSHDAHEPKEVRKVNCILEGWERAASAAELGSKLFDVQRPKHVKQRRIQINQSKSEHTTRYNQISLRINSCNPVP